ncbi:MAG: hypothetical protein IPJ55_17555 [Chloracidobacterium sp.]|nr:hypothetical protein [Chloracidobacterium sp.]
MRLKCWTLSKASGAGYASNAKEMTVEMLAMVFDLDYIIVAGGSKNTAKEGQTAAVKSALVRQYTMVCRSRNRKRLPSLASVRPSIGLRWFIDRRDFRDLYDETKRSGHCSSSSRC